MAEKSNRGKKEKSSSKRKANFKSISVKKAQKERSNTREKTLSGTKIKKSKYRKRKRKVPTDSSKNWGVKTQESEVKSADSRGSLSKSKARLSASSSRAKLSASSSRAKLPASSSKNNEASLSRSKSMLRKPSETKTKPPMKSKEAPQSKSLIKSSKEKTTTIGKLQVINPKSTGAKKSIVKMPIKSVDRSVGPSVSAMIKATHEAGETPDLGKIDQAAMEEYTTMKTYFIIKKYTGEDGKPYEEEISRNVVITKYVITEQVVKRLVKSIKDELPPDAISKSFASLDSAFGVPKSILAEIAAREPSMAGTFEFPPGMSPGDRSPSVLGSSKRPSEAILADLAREPSGVAGGFGKDPSAAGLGAGTEFGGVGGVAALGREGSTPLIDPVTGLAREPSAAGAPMIDPVTGLAREPSTSGAPMIDPVTGLARESSGMPAGAPGRQPTFGDFKDGKAPDAFGQGAAGLAREPSAAQGMDLDISTLREPSTVGSDGLSGSDLSREPSAAMTEEMKISPKVHKLGGLKGSKAEAGSGELVDLSTGKRLTSDGAQDSLAREASATTKPDFFEEVGERKRLADSSAPQVGVQAGADRFTAPSDAQLVAAAAREPDGKAPFGFLDTPLPRDESMARMSSDAKVGAAGGLAREPSQAGSGAGAMGLAREGSAPGGGFGAPGQELQREASAQLPADGSSVARSGTEVFPAGREADGRQPIGFLDTPLPRDSSMQRMSSDARGVGGADLQREPSKAAAMGAGGPGQDLAREPSTAPSMGPASAGREPSEAFNIALPTSPSGTGGGGGAGGPASGLPGADGNAYLGREISMPTVSLTGLSGATPSELNREFDSAGREASMEGIVDTIPSHEDILRGPSLYKQNALAGLAREGSAAGVPMIDPVTGLAREQSGLSGGVPGRQPTFGDFKDGKAPDGFGQGAAGLAREPSAAQGLDLDISTLREPSTIGSGGLGSPSSGLVREGSMAGQSPGGGPSASLLGREPSGAPGGQQPGAEFGGVGGVAALGREGSTPMIDPVTGLAREPSGAGGPMIDPVTGLAREPSSAARDPSGMMDGVPGRQPTFGDFKGGQAPMIDPVTGLAREPSAAGGPMFDPVTGLLREPSAAGRDPSGMMGGVPGRQPTFGDFKDGQIPPDGMDGLMREGSITNPQFKGGPSTDAFGQGAAGLAREPSAAQGMDLDISTLREPSTIGSGGLGSPSSGLGREGSMAGQQPGGGPSASMLGREPSGAVPGQQPGTEFGGVGGVAALGREGSTPLMIDPVTGLAREPSAAGGPMVDGQGAPISFNFGREPSGLGGSGTPADLQREGSGMAGPGAPFPDNLPPGREPTGLSPSTVARQPSAQHKELVMVKVKREPTTPATDMMLSREPSTSAGKQLVRIKIKSAPQPQLTEDDLQLSRESSMPGVAALPDHDSGGGEKPPKSTAIEVAAATDAVAATTPHKELVMVKIKSAALVKSAQLVSMGAAREPSETFMQVEPVAPGRESNLAATPVSLPVSAAAATTAGPVLTLMKIKSAVGSRPKSMTLSPGLLREPSMIKSAPMMGVAPSALAEGDAQIGREASIVAVQPLPEMAAAAAGAAREPSMMTTKTEVDTTGMGAKPVLREAPKSMVGDLRTGPGVSPDGTLAREPSMTGAPTFVPFTQSQTGAGLVARDPSGQMLGEDAWREQSGLVGLGMGMPNELMREGQSMTGIGPVPTGGGVGPVGELAREPSMTGAPTFAPFDDTSTMGAMALARDGSQFPLGATTSDSTLRESSNIAGIKTPPKRDASGQEINLSFGREPSGLGRGVGADGQPSDSGMLGAQSSQSTMREPSSGAISVPVGASREPSGEFRRESTQMFKVDDLGPEGSSQGPMRDASGNVVGPTSSQVGREASSSAGPDFGSMFPDTAARDPSMLGAAPDAGGTMREGSIVGPTTSAPGRAPSAREPEGMGMVPYDGSTAMIGTVPPGSNELLGNLGREGSMAGGVPGATGPDAMLARDGSFVSPCPSSPYQADQSGMASMGLAREPSGVVPGAAPSESTMREPSAVAGIQTPPRRDASGQLLGEDAWREQSGLVGIGVGLPNELGREMSATGAGGGPPGGGPAREGSAAGGLPGISPSQLAREPSAQGGGALPPGMENLAREASLGSLGTDSMLSLSKLPMFETTLQPDQMPKGMDRVADMTGAVAPQAPVIIFRPTIVIVQNNIVIPADILQKLLAQHQQQQQQNPQSAPPEPSSLVTVQNQEVFIYPNRIEASNMSAAYTHNANDPKPFLNFQK